MREDRELFHKPAREMVLTSNQDARVISSVKIKPAPLNQMLQRVKTARLIRDLPEAEQPQPATNQSLSPQEHRSRTSRYLSHTVRAEQPLMHGHREAGR